MINTEEIPGLVKAPKWNQDVHTEGLQSPPGKNFHWVLAGETNWIFRSLSDPPHHCVYAFLPTSVKVRIKKWGSRSFIYSLPPWGMIFQPDQAESVCFDNSEGSVSVQATEESKLLVVRHDRPSLGACGLPGLPWTHHLCVSHWHRIRSVKKPD